MFPVQWFINNWFCIWIFNRQEMVFWHRKLVHNGYQILYWHFYRNWPKVNEKCHFHNLGWEIGGNEYLRPNLLISYRKFVFAILFLTLPPFGHNPNSFLKIFLLFIQWEIIGFLFRWLLFFTHKISQRWGKHRQLKM